MLFILRKGVSGGSRAEQWPSGLYPFVGLRAPGPTIAQLSPTMRFCRAMNSVRMRKRLRKVLDLILATDALVGSLEDASLD